jgi:hypothetical protein
MLKAQLLGELCLAAALYVCATGCADPDPETEQTTDHVTETLARATDYQSAEFVLINEVPRPSLAVAGAEVRVWVSREAVEAYRGAEVLPEGATIVREVLRSGVLEKITLLAKGPPGTNPELGDLWFAVFDAQGNVLPDKAGVPQLGNLADCIACHKTRAERAFLFGLQ